MDEFKRLCEKFPTLINDEAILNIAEPVLIFGVGQVGRDLCGVLQKHGYKVNGFIQTIPTQNEICGLPVINWSELSADQRQMQLVVGVFNRANPIDKLISQIETAGIKRIFLSWKIYEIFEEDLKNISWRYWLGARRDILNKMESIEFVYRNLSDHISRRCLIDILTFRLGFKNEYASFKHDENQYFNEITLPAYRGYNIKYIDGGAYVGDTYIELKKLTDINISAAFLFEPDLENFNKLTLNVKKLQGTNLCIPLALADTYRILSFNAGAGEAGAISDHGSQHIAAVSLDEIMQQESIDFIKFDIEGAEISAIKGAAALIERCRPTLAISLYHRPADLWEIPELLSTLCKNYNFYIRQHYFNSFDSVFYAVPK